MNSKLLTAGVILSVVLGISANFQSPEVVREIVKEQTVGAIASPDVLTHLNVHGEFSQAGGILATSTSDTTEVFQAADLRNYNVIDLTPTTGSTTYTLPATTTFPLLPYAGSYRQWVLRNASTTSGITATIAAPTGIDLQEPDGQNVVISNTNFAWLTCYRKIDTDIVCLVDESIPAD